MTTGRINQVAGQGRDRLGSWAGLTRAAQSFVPSTSTSTGPGGRAWRCIHPLSTHSPSNELARALTHHSIPPGSGRAPLFPFTLYQNATSSLPHLDARTCRRRQDHGVCLCTRARTFAIVIAGKAHITYHMCMCMCLCRLDSNRPPPYI